MFDMVSYFLMFWKVHWLFVSFAYHYCRINAYLSLQLSPISNGFCEVILFVQQGRACVMFRYLVVLLYFVSDGLLFSLGNLSYVSD